MALRYKPAASAREDAVHRLLRIEEEGAYIGLESSDDAALDSRETRQSKDYVAGVTRWRRRLDYILSHYYHGDLDSMEPALKQILRVGLYDVLFLQTPEYAAVSEAVDLAKRKVRRGAGGLVNGVLRSIIRQRNRLPAPSTGDPADDLAITHSHPTWMVERWLDRYGVDDTTALLEWNNSRPVYGVRVNTLKTSVDDFKATLRDLDVEWQEGRFLPYYLGIRNVQALLEAGLLQDGCCSIQDEGAALLVTLLDPQPGDTVLDVCAAPGGKALYAAQLMQNEGRLVAADLHAGRLRLVERGAQQQGIDIIETVVKDAREPDPRSMEADRVLVDAPCSGLGVLAKRADLRWRRVPGDLAELTRLQDQVLDTASKLVTPGGVLVYGTCTLEPEENNDRVAAFLERHDDFSLEDASAFVPPGVPTKDGYYATFPPRHYVDGAFGARLRRSEG